jgi:ketosteroid isomerase-like protein
MRTRILLAAGLVLAAQAVAPAVASGETTSAAHPGSGPRQHCVAEFDAAVKEDNDAYEARDPARYQAILNPDVIVKGPDGSVIQGRDKVMEGAIAAFAVPGWHWRLTVLSRTVYGCHSGIAIADAHTTYPDLDKHWSITMTMVREKGKWTVAMDTIDRLPA